MATTRISLIGEAYDNVAAIFDGTVRPEGIEIAASRSPSPEAMRRQLTGWEFDVCEMAFGAYLIARAKGADVTAIPVFPRRAFFHTQFVVNDKAGIARPEDLAGRRIGVAGYVQSATLWARGVLEQDFALDPASVDWYVERAGGDSTGEVLGFSPPSGMRVHQTPGGAKVAAMVAAGELDVALVGSLFQQMASPFPAGTRPLFPDVVLEGRRFIAAHGYVPANHMYMVRGSLARERPDVVDALYRAFIRAGEQAQARLTSRSQIGSLYGNEYLRETCAPLGAAAFACGIAGNRGMLEDVVKLCRQQGLIDRTPAIEEMFAPGLQ